VIFWSIFADGKPLAKCSGVCIKWDEESKTGIILTTAHLIRSEHPTINQWEGRDKYNIKANVSFFLNTDLSIYLFGLALDANTLDHITSWCSTQS
jgi:hypothetical protein